MLSRRSFIAMTAIALPRLLHAQTAKAAGSLDESLAELERVNGGRLGVAILDTGTGARVGYRADERFPMCSTFKFLLVAAVLRRVDRHRDALERAVGIPPKPLLFNSPLTEPHARRSMSVAALCHAALTRSDNTAANLLLASIGGPSGVTRFARSIGDKVTRLDRQEPALNESLADDPRDTTSPMAMAGNLESVLLKGVLSPASRDQLTAWMEQNQTGLDRLRAGLPQGWRVADKTGANGEHTSNDIAVFWPEGRPPLIAAAYITQCPGPESKRAAMLAEIGRLARVSL
ncbi:class A beta-lactamase [Telmatospirillum siberiense]|uniref:Beta-lactamase n=1 Tax=Telmatospirillum siberiense TaxID=382514 RepID=A0A2N3PWJ4_9PROT|nr:class A beta-lactamase [Telmatospirillum siberiense]PKU24748.1 class A beta-lactamase [Telmatospirillum siberiense]